MFVMAERRRRRSSHINDSGIDQYELLQYYSAKMPHADELERSVLATCFTDQDIAEDVAYKVKPEWFYSMYNQDIFKAIRFIAKCKLPITVETVGKELERRCGIVPEDYLQQLINGGGSPKNVEYHIAIIGQYYMIREIMGIGQQYAVIDNCADCDEVYMNFKQACQTLDKNISPKSRPQPSWHLLKPDDRMPFGKYKGYAVSQVIVMEAGIEYLEWCEDNVNGVYIDWPAMNEWRNQHITVGIGMNDTEDDSSCSVGNPLPF